MILLFGRGILGSAVRSVFAKQGEDVYTIPRETLDFQVASTEVFANVLTELKVRPSYVINAAAYTDVSRAEKEHQTCFRVNSLAVDSLSRACFALGYRLIHISSNFVFDGRKSTAYTEEDEERPISTYGLSKWLAEKFITAAHPDALIVRTGFLYNERSGFIPGMLRALSASEHFSAVSDQIIAPTSSVELAKQLWLITRHPELSGGVYHATCHGYTTPYELAWRLVHENNLKTEVTKVSINKFYEGSAQRPAMGLLENAKLHSLGLDIMANWQDALGELDI